MSDPEVVFRDLSLEAEIMDKVQFKFLNISMVGESDNSKASVAFSVIVDGKESGTVSIIERTICRMRDGKLARKSLSQMAQGAQDALADILTNAARELRDSSSVLPPVKQET